MDAMTKEEEEVITAAIERVNRVRPFVKDAGDRAKERSKMAIMRERSAIVMANHLVSVGHEVENWIEANYGGRGRALRTQAEPPLDDEPWMSMREARELTRLAVLEFVLRERLRELV